MIHNWYENMLYYMIKSIFGCFRKKKKAKKLMSFSKSNVKHIAVKKRRRKKTQQRLWCPQKIKE
jgi:hypothetical protein